MVNHKLMQQVLIIFIMMLFSFYLQELQPRALQVILPEWPFLLVLYFSVSTRYFFSIFSAFIIGLIQDVFLALSTVGLHAGIYVLASFTIIVMRLNFKHMNIGTQSLIIGVFVFIKIILFNIHSVIFYTMPHEFWSFISVPLSVFAWPSIYFFFHFFAIRYR